MSTKTISFILDNHGLEYNIKEDQIFSNGDNLTGYDHDTLAEWLGYDVNIY